MLQMLYWKFLWSPVWYTFLFTSQNERNWNNMFWSIWFYDCHISILFILLIAWTPIFSSTNAKVKLIFRPTKLVSDCLYAGKSINSFVKYYLNFIEQSRTIIKYRFCLHILPCNLFSSSHKILKKWQNKKSCIKSCESPEVYLCMTYKNQRLKVGILF